MRRRAFIRATTTGLGALGPTARVRGHPTPNATSLGTEHNTPRHSAFTPLASIPIDGAKDAVVGPPGTTVYVAATDGFVIVDIKDPAQPTILADHRQLLANHENGPLRDIQDVKIHGNRLLVVGPAHPGGSDTLHAALLYDVSTPTEPELLTVHETSFPIHNSYIDANAVYLTAFEGNRNPLVILHGETLDEIGRWSILDGFPQWEEVNPRLRILHDLWVHEDTAYLAYWDAGTWIVDVSDPRSPSFLGRAGGRPRETLAGIDESVSDHVSELPGNHHSAVVDPTGTLLGIGKEAWSTDETKAPGGIDLWDVSTPAAPTRISTIPPPPTPDPSRNGTWTTAHNFELDAGRLYSSWYQGGVKIHDIRNPSAPVEVAWWHDPQATRFWTAQRAANCIVAISMGITDDPPGLYTFPLPTPPATDPRTSPPSLLPRVTAAETVLGAMGILAVIGALAIGWHRRARHR